MTTAPQATTRLETRRRIAVVVIALLAIVTALPALPAAVAGVTHRGAVTADGDTMLGYVTVDRCTRSALLFDWVCRGTFEVNDPMAEPYADVPDVTVANDPRHHHSGDTIDTSLPFHSHSGYLWGGVQDLKTIGFCVGVLLCVIVVIAVLSERRDVHLALRIGLFLGVCLVVGLTPIL